MIGRASCTYAWAPMWAAPAVARGKRRSGGGLRGAGCYSAWRSEFVRHAWKGSSDRMIYLDMDGVSCAISPIVSC